MFWVWAAFIVFGAGFVGAGLNCEYGCEGSNEPVPWARPWTLGSHYVFPEVFFVALGGLASASLVVIFVGRRRPLAATGGTVQPRSGA